MQTKYAIGPAAIMQQRRQEIWIEQSLSSPIASSDDFTSRLIFRLTVHPTASRLPAKFRGQKVQTLIRFICSVAFERGLTSSALTSLLDVVTLPNHLDEASTATLIKHFYPAEDCVTSSNGVLSGLVCKVVCSLGQGKGKPPVTTQNNLLRWLTMTYDVLGDHSILTKLYGALFNMLDLPSIRCVIRLEC